MIGFVEFGSRNAEVGKKPELRTVGDGSQKARKLEGWKENYYGGLMEAFIGSRELVSS